MDVLLVLLLIGAAVWFFQRRAGIARTRELEGRRQVELAAVRKVVDEDLTRFGEELQRLDHDLLVTDLDEAGRQDYQRALDSYEAAKESMALLQQPEDVSHVTRTLEDGRYAVTCVKARVAGEPLPTRRPPCFFNPAHGPSTDDVSWAPPGGQARQVPVCAADADRLSQGAEPDVRTVQQGVRRVPYWQGGPAYSPYTQGYFGGYAMSGLLPGFLLGSVMAGAWSDPGWSGDGGDADADAGGDAGDGGDGGDMGDAGGDMGGDGGFDFGGFDF